MTATNYLTALQFVWRAGFDNPADRYHVTPGDPGGGTFGGVTEATWRDATLRGGVSGALETASYSELSTVLHDGYWGSVCDALPDGVDLLMFNGRMMTGAFPRLFQAALGVVTDGQIGPRTLDAARVAVRTDLIDHVTMRHIFYLSGLETWVNFHTGWLTRLLAACDAAKGVRT